MIQVYEAGLDWESAVGTVYMPSAKTGKSLRRAESSSAFYQRLHVVSTAAPTNGNIVSFQWLVSDLLWFGGTLHSGTLCGVPIRLLGSLPQPEVHVYMDTSGDGICILIPEAKRCVANTFDADELSDPVFDINVGEQFAVASVSPMFGPSWDNGYVPRTYKLSVSHCAAQELNRSIRFVKATWRFHISTAHLPEACNSVTDAGSRLRNLVSRTSRPCGRKFQFYHSYDGFLQRSRCTSNRTTGGKLKAALRQNIEPMIDVTPMQQGSRSYSSLLLVCRIARYIELPIHRFAKCSHLSWHHQVRYGYSFNLSIRHRLCFGCVGCWHISNAEVQPTSLTSAEFSRSSISTRPATANMGAAVLGYTTYVGVNGLVNRFVICRSDVTITDNPDLPTVAKSRSSPVTLIFRESKTDQAGKSTTYMQVAYGIGGFKVAPLCWANGAILPVNAVVKIIKRAAEPTATSLPSSLLIHSTVVVSRLFFKLGVTIQPSRFQISGQVTASSVTSMSK
ncbi:Hypothetical protein PHPALM_14491 [Phytophthora palmivora]|uniref:Uncharacterized protein n=1 Tax=Phytophthora palmivora TaxID=4796 RepID=A0A2P4XUN2_9STRA|nr:Hypothetical protein PHPALM_14491 [Phytophthora palmivora]